jgi:hypothetical protein
MLNDYLNQQMQGMGPQALQNSPMAGMPQQDMMLGQVPLTPGDVTGLASGLRGAAGLAGRVKQGLGFGREMLENAGPAAARNPQGLAGAMASYGDEALPMVPQQAPPGPAGALDMPPGGQMPNPYMPEGGLGPTPPMPQGPVQSPMTTMGGSTPEIGQIMSMLPPETASAVAEMVAGGIPFDEVMRAVLSGGF